MTRRPLSREADITINGVALTYGQAMSVRVAVSHMLMELADPETTRDLGPISDGYRTRLREVEKMLVEGASHG